jgi:hypothetical protein
MRNKLQQFNTDTIQIRGRFVIKGLKEIDDLRWASGIKGKGRDIRMIRNIG